MDRVCRISLPHWITLLYEARLSCAVVTEISRMPPPCGHRHVGLTHTACPLQADGGVCSWQSLTTPSQQALPRGGGEFPRVCSSNQMLQCGSDMGTLPLQLMRGQAPWLTQGQGGRQVHCGHVPGQIHIQRLSALYSMYQHSANPRGSAEPCLGKHLQVALCPGWTRGRPPLGFLELFPTSFH